MRFFKYFSIAVLILVAALIWRHRSSDYQVLSGKIFGTYYSIKVRTPYKIRDFAPIVEREFALVNRQMSVFEPDSELNRINRAPNGKWIEIPAELYRLLADSQTIYRQSGGAFDPTVGPLVSLWGFGPGGKQKIPEAKEVKSTLKRIGFNKIKLKKPNMLMKTDAFVSLDLSAIAKGYAVDVISNRLKELGYADFIVDIGGEVYASGSRAEGESGWNIGIAEPEEGQNKNLMSLGLTDMAVATSGNYRNFYYVDGKRYSHTISPQTGYPAEDNLLSASVFDRSCEKADAYATAIMAMGEKRGLVFANKHNLTAILFVRGSNGEIDKLYSEQAQKLLGE